MTQSTTTFSRGDVVMVDFLYVSQQASKHRPALVVSSDVYHARRNDVVLVALTSNVHRDLPGDTLLTEWAAASLPRPSVATAIFRTVKRGDILHRLGSLTTNDLSLVESNLRTALQL